MQDNGFTQIEIEELFNNLETLDYEIDNKIYIGLTFAKNERLAKYFSKR